MTKSVYIAGPMRGYEFYNFKAFFAAAQRLLDAGYWVSNPAQLDIDAGFNPFAMPENHDWSKYPEDPGFDCIEAFDRDAEAIKRCDAIYMLAGWQNSRNAVTEKGIAEWMQKEVMFEAIEAGCAGDDPEAATQTPETEPEAVPPLPEDAKARKEYPLYRGLFQYFPNALAAVANHSWKGNQQHHPDKPLHWDRNKSTDEEDALLRHVMQGDWEAAAWRALAKLQKHLEDQENNTEFAQ